MQKRPLRIIDKTKTTKHHDQQNLNINRIEIINKIEYIDRIKINRKKIYKIKIAMLKNKTIISLVKKGNKMLQH